jgi:hypothetical protein
MTNFLLRLIVLQLTFAMLVSACARVASPGQLSTSSPATPTQEVNMPTDTPLPPTSPQKDNMPSDLPPGPTQGDDMPRDLPLPIPRSPGLQALIERAKADLAKRLSIQASQIEVIGTQEAAWQDASLGCRQPGATYAQIPTPGYIITLKSDPSNFRDSPESISFRFPNSLNATGC